MTSPEFIKPDWDVAANVVALVTTRSGGVSKNPYRSFNLGDHVGDNAEAVAKNRHLLTQQLHPDLRWQWLQQVHGNKVVKISQCNSVLTADGLSTSVPGIACCILTADCLSVFFADKLGSEVAIAHAGWRGLVSGIIENTVDSMDTIPANLSVWLGPGIGPCHFEVGPEVREQFLAAVTTENVLPETRSCFKAIAGSSKYLCDLFELARIRLSNLGINAISGGDECTFCQHERFYSYRREGRTGRLLSAIYLQPNSSD